jgi:hypothetical protein
MARPHTEKGDVIGSAYGDAHCAELSAEFQTMEFQTVGSPGSVSVG